jgi:hypothetical protein
MGGIFSSSSPTPEPPPPPLPPIEEATFDAGSGDKSRKALKKKAAGKKRLQIPLNKGPAKKALQSGE